MHACAPGVDVQARVLLALPACRHIVKYIGYGSSDSSKAQETMFLVQEFMDAGTLRMVRHPRVCVYAP